MTTEGTTHAPDQLATTPPRALAIVVAYNSPVALERCLRSLDSQSWRVDGVLVVDNSEPTPLDLADLDLPLLERTRCVPMEGNLGPAGGFAFGLGWFQESPTFTHAWLMDDDSYPEPDALRILLSAAEATRPGSAVFPSAVYQVTGVAMNYPGWSGVLLDRLAVRLAGLPLAELFWWAEDTEYLQHRLPRKGVKVVRADEARVLYDLIRRVGGRPAWKYYYEVRNMIWVRTVAQRGSEIHKLPRSLVRLLGSAVVSEGRTQKVGMYAKGFAHGVIGRLGHQVKPPAPRARDDA